MQQKHNSNAQNRNQINRCKRNTQHQTASHFGLIETFPYVRLPEDSKGLHYGLFLDGVLISVVSLFKNKDGWKFRVPSLQDQQVKAMVVNYLTMYLLLQKEKKPLKFTVMLV